MKKIFFIFLFVLIFLPFYQSQAAGLVPCGYDLNGDGVFDPKTEGCTVCHFFTMVNNIIGEFFRWVVTTAAVLMLIIGGVLFFFAGAKPDAVNKAKGIITSVVIGLLIIFSTWVIINTVFEKIGVINMPSGWKWYEVGCK